MRRSAKHRPEQLFYQMARMRAFEEAIARLWERGLISGELHLGTGEEAVVAGVVSHLGEGDALALDHRSTPPLVARGIDLRAVILELLGHEKGLCRGRGGHMHLFAPELLAASSGIVGAAAPLACGFALSAQHVSPGKVAVAFFGEGAMNQGMVMESLNLAAVWKLPVLFVCKDSRFAITTDSPAVTAGDLLGRARSFGVPATRVDGTSAEAVWKAADEAVQRARQGRGPSFILARCHHLHGHFLGDPFLRVLRRPLNETLPIVGPLIEASRRSPGTSARLRVEGLASLGRTILSFVVEQYVRTRDPLKVARARLARGAARRLEERARAEVTAAVAASLEIAGVGQRA